MNDIVRNALRARFSDLDFCRAGGRLLLLKRFRIDCMKPVHTKEGCGGSSIVMERFGGASVSIAFVDVGFGNRSKSTVVVTAMIVAALVVLTRTVDLGNGMSLVPSVGLTFAGGG